MLECWDRVVIFGTLPKLCYAEGMTSYLYGKQVRIFDYPKFAEPFRDQLRENAERLAAANGIEIQSLRKRNARKEDLVKQAVENFSSSATGLRPRCLPAPRRILI